MRKLSFLTIVLSLVVLAFSACEKAVFESVSTFNVRFAASSGFDAEQVNVTVTEVKVSYKDNEWVTLEARKEPLNLLDLTSGKDTLIAKGTLPATSVVKQMKVVFAEENTIKLGGKVLPLLNGNNTREVSLIVDRKLNYNVENLVIAIDTKASITEAITGGLRFAPVLSIK